MFFLLSLTYFLLQKSENRRMEQIIPRGGWHQWRQGGGGEKGRKMNMVQIMYTHVCKCKIDTC
jgi:hypothetical protein